MEPTRGQFLSEDPSFQTLGDPTRLAQLNNHQQKVLLTDPQSLNSYSYARGNPVINKDPTGLCFEPVSALVCVYAAYTAASLAVDAYDAYNTNFKYGDVFSQEEKNQTNFKFGTDIALTLVGGKFAKDAGKAAGVGFDSLTSILDALDTYFGDEMYKKYNENRDTNKQSTMQGTSKSSANINSTSNVQVNRSYANTSQNSTQGGSGGYNRLVGGLNSLVSSLKAYVSSLQGTKDKNK